MRYARWTEAGRKIWGAQAVRESASGSNSRVRSGSVSFSWSLPFVDPAYLVRGTYAMNYFKSICVTLLSGSMLFAGKAATQSQGFDATDFLAAKEVTRAATTTVPPEL